MDVCESIQTSLFVIGIEASLQRLDSFTGQEGVVIRRVIPEVSQRYMDGTRTVGFIAHIIVRNRSERRAMDLCEQIADYLQDRPLPSLDGSYKWTATNIYTEPQELALDEENFYAWDTRIEVVIERS